ncbi:MAG: hypothetical protein ACAI34_07145 [Verrucomicrobium sp.]|nr:hypothetical protein [Verrucomicrobium sp.]
MPLIPSQYQQIRTKMLPGDIVAFSGKTHFSGAIKWATSSSVSHVGVVCQAVSLAEGGVEGDVVIDIVEATFLHRDPATGQSAGGVLRNRLCHHIEHYEGHIWWLPLHASVRQRLDMEKFSRFLLDQSGKGYDAVQALKSGFDFADDVPFLRRTMRNEEDFSKLFCSELVAAALEAGGVIGQINASEVTPFDICTFNLFDEEYHQLKGEVLEIGGYNSRCPEKFGV